MATSWRRRLIKWGLILLVVLGAIGYGLYWLAHNWDPARVIYKRWQAESRYTFDEIPPWMQEVDAASLIFARDAAAIDALRLRVQGAVYGEPGLPDRTPMVEALLPEPVRGLTGLPRLALVERMEVPFEFDYAATPYHLRPEDWNGRTVIYNHGYAGDIGQASPLIAGLMEAGFAVVAIHFLGYGETPLDNVYDPRFGPMTYSNDNILRFGRNGLRYYIDPAISVVNHIVANLGQDRVAMIGFSAGGWVTTVAAAMDTRIDLSISIAGLYPMYVRESTIHGNEAPPPHFDPRLLEATNYLDMFVGAASGAGRRYVQIFNQYDRCCYRNRFGELYEGAVQDAVRTVGPGAFDVMIDTSHADHKISDWAIARILELLGGDGG